MKGWPAWTVQPNDLIGGWIVTTFPYPASAHDHRLDGNPLHCGYIIAECMTEADASIIARSLNEARYVPAAADSQPERWRWVSAGYLEGTLR